MTPEAWKSLGDFFLHQTTVLWGAIGGFVYLGLAVWAAVHALMNKQNVRSATAWIGLIWFAPLIGMILYYVFGINRIQRRARARFEETRHVDLPEFDHTVVPPNQNLILPEPFENLRSLARLNTTITELPLLEGNRIEPLFNGEQAYPAMLEAIDQAERSISLCLYIFQRGGIGDQFIDALTRAHQRGVEVRVIVDDVGARHASPSGIKPLRNNGVPVEAFMQTLFPWRFRYINLRNHRKILVVDGKLGFTGGMNVTQQYYSNPSNPSEPPDRDTHFRVEGPVVKHLQYAFAEDWIFCTGEELSGSAWFPELEPTGSVYARGIIDGPDMDYDKIRHTLLGAVTSAEESIEVCTPYFLPDDELLSALQIAAMRGIVVNILVPEQTNTLLVQWASWPGLVALAERGCNIYRVPKPFNHSKLMVVDGRWSLFGSTNWDARSMKLNFEFDVETYDTDLASEISDRLEQWKAAGTNPSVEDLKNRSFPSKVRDQAVRLFSPYL